MGWSLVLARKIGTFAEFGPRTSDRVNSRGRQKTLEKDTIGLADPWVYGRKWGPSSIARKISKFGAGPPRCGVGGPGPNALGRTNGVGAQNPPRPDPHFKRYIKGVHFLKPWFAGPTAKFVPEMRANLAPFYLDSAVSLPIFSVSRNAKKSFRGGDAPIGPAF